IGAWGLFLKANSALVGPSQGVALRFPDRRNDHEVELAVVIGRPGTNIARARALDHVAGYAIGLDMTVRGTELPSFRKSIDSYAVLGPWLVTAEEIANPNALDFSIQVNGTVRQKSNTRYLDFDVERLIEFASSFYTLLPGDIIMTGTPAGVGPVAPGDIMSAEIAGIGAMEVKVRAA
ncbi:MAG: fumarylacetoacetate hydrolase family protein, partial [Alphaproteobacteria bacterium]|nr:fumarylacetoacetate hydrolase family protein [Alphaproteobacteria bacterium]